MCQEQPTLSKIKAIFLAEEILLQHIITFSQYFYNLYKYKLAIEVDEQGHNSRDIDYEIERQKAIEKNLVVNLLELIQLKKTLIFLLRLVKYKITLLNQLKN